jgi:hypothetical protein
MKGQRMFRIGEIVVSKTSGARVVVTGLSDDGKWFAGVCIGSAQMPQLPDQFRYYWHEWSAANFRPAA